MGHIYRNLPAIPVPPDAHINGYDNRVFQESKRNGKRCKLDIGVLANVEKRTMHVNDNFRRNYPHLWEKYYKSLVASAAQISAGLYALTLSIGVQTGLYAMLQQHFGPQHGNAIMDFSMYSIRERSGTAQLFSEDMKYQMLFSRKPMSDAWYSNLFSHEMSIDSIHAFRTSWLERCAKEGTRRVWLCIDGSNNDCATSDSNLAHRGHAKSMHDTNIVSYMWAVEAESGRPITWFVNKGNMPDCKAIDEVVRFLASSEIQVEGVILDRGFASQEVIDLIKQNGMAYIVMLKNNCAGFIEMLARHANDIRWNVRNAISDEGIFGVTDHVKVFSGNNSDSCVGLFFSAMNSTTKIIRLIGKIRRAAKSIKQNIFLHRGDPNKIVIPDDLKKYLKLQFGADGTVTGVEYDYDAWQGTSDRYGFHAIASSQDLSAEKIHDLYQLRSVSEKQYCLLKSQLDGGVTRVHSDEAIQARFALSFVASIIRTELLLACRGMELDINVMLRKADDIRMTRMTGGEYEAVRTYSADINALLAKCYGIRFEHIQQFAQEVNAQEKRPVNDQERRLPDVTPPRRGRKKGSKNKKTIAREAKTAKEAAKQAAEQAVQVGSEKTEASEKDSKVQEVERRRPGRPKGSKNKKTLEREAAIAAGLLPAPTPRKPGRPKGSKNKKTLEREAAIAAGLLPAPTPGKPGRPKGSKNKKTLEREARLAAQEKRGRGRPKGSKNKPKTLTPISSQEGTQSKKIGSANRLSDRPA